MGSGARGYAEDTAVELAWWRHKCRQSSCVYNEKWRTTTDGTGDGGQIELHQDDAGSTAGGIGGSLERDTDVGTGQSQEHRSRRHQSWHTTGETFNTPDDPVLVPGEDSSEPPASRVWKHELVPILEAFTDA